MSGSTDFFWQCKSNFKIMLKIEHNLIDETSLNYSEGTAHSNKVRLLAKQVDLRKFKCNSHYLNEPFPCKKCRYKDLSRILKQV